MLNLNEKYLQISSDVFVVVGHKVFRRLYDESITSLSIFGTKCLKPAKMFTINLIRAETAAHSCMWSVESEGRGP